MKHDGCDVFFKLTLVALSLLAAIPVATLASDRNTQHLFLPVISTGDSPTTANDSSTEMDFSSETELKSSPLAPTPLPPSDQSNEHWTVDFDELPPCPDNIGQPGVPAPPEVTEAGGCRAVIVEGDDDLPPVPSMIPISVLNVVSDTLPSDPTLIPTPTAPLTTPWLGTD
jgi:hypothetical protein